MRVADPVTFAVTASYDADPASVGGMYAITCDGQKLSAYVKAGEQSQAVGKLKLPPGNHQIRVEAVQIAGKELMCLRSLTLSGVVNETASR